MHAEAKRRGQNVFTPILFAFFPLVKNLRYSVYSRLYGRTVWSYFVVFILFVYFIVISVVTYAHVLLEVAVIEKFFHWAHVDPVKIPFVVWTCVLNNFNEITKFAWLNKPKSSELLGYFLPSARLQHVQYSVVEKTSESNGPIVYIALLWLRKRYDGTWVVSKRAHRVIEHSHLIGSSSRSSSSRSRRITSIRG